MNPNENKKNTISEMNKLLPSDLFEEDEGSIVDDSDSSDNGFNNYILEENEPEIEVKDRLFPNFDSNEGGFRQFKAPTTRYSDSYILNNYRQTLQMRMNTPHAHQPSEQGSLHQSFGKIPLVNQSFVSYSPQIHPHPPQHQLNDLYDFGFQQQQVIPNQLLPPKISNNYFEQINIGYHQPMRYQSNDNLIAISNTIPNMGLNLKKLQGPLFKKKYNSSNNVSSQFVRNNSINNNSSTNNTEHKKNNTKRNRSSLFVNKTSENKPECDIRDFKRFCDGLKCEIDLYICSQIGSRIMQKYLSKFPADILTLLINKLSFDIPKIMVDKYGNYFCQKLIKIASKEQRVLILQHIQNYFHAISKESTGTHVLQTLLEVINSREEKAIVLNAIAGHELEMAYNTNGTHVLQQILIAIEEPKRTGLNQILLDNFKELCLNSKGICVIKKFISTSLSCDICLIVIKHLSRDFLKIAESPYGNYLIQYIIEEWKIETWPQILQLIIKDIVFLSMQKFSSNIIEKLISHTPKEIQNIIINELFNAANFNILLPTKYGKFILAKCISIMDKEQVISIQKELIETISAPKGKNRKKTIIDLFNVENSNDAI